MVRDKVDNRCEPENGFGLPARLFATGRYPVGRVNVYSRPDLLAFVHKHMNGTDEWVDIVNSSFGHLFTIPVTRCYISCKLIHSLLSRQLVTKRRYEMWTVFGRQPLRFSLVEFEAVTGLNCQPFPSEYDPGENTECNIAEGSVWHTLFGHNKEAKISDLMNLLGESNRLCGWRKTGLALLLIVEGVLIANHQGDKRPTPKYVEMLRDRDSFLNFPWGRESFVKTISSLIPSRVVSSKDVSGCIIMQNQLKQVSISLKGFPLALQLVAFNAIPALADQIPNANDMRAVTEVYFLAHAKNAALSIKSFRKVEDNPEVSVRATANVDGPFSKVAFWTDEVDDESVIVLEQLIEKGHVFDLNDWTGGDLSLPKAVRRKGKNVRENNVVCASRGRVSKQKDVKTRRSGYCTRSCGSVENGLIGGSSCPSVVGNCGSGDVFAEEEYVEREYMAGSKITTGVDGREPSFNVGIKQGETDGSKEASTFTMGDIKDNDLKMWMERRLEEVNAVWVKRFERLRNEMKKRELVRRKKRRKIFSRISKRLVPVYNNHEVFRRKKYRDLNRGKSVMNDFADDWLMGAGYSDNFVADVDKVLVRDLVVYSELNSSWYNYTPVPEELICPVLYSDDSGVNHCTLIKRKSDAVEDDVSVVRRKKKLRKVDSEAKKASLLNTKYVCGARKDDSPLVSGPAEVDNPQVRKISFEISESSPQTQSPIGRSTVGEKELANELNHSYVVNPFPVLQQLDFRKYEALQKKLEVNLSRRYITKCNFEFDNKFLLALGRPTSWVNTLHMEILMDMLGKHHAETLAWSRAAFVTPLLVNYILSDQKQFEHSEDKRSFEWSSRIRNLVAKPGSEWLVDVDLFYMPVIWGNRHWAGLVIDLRAGLIQVLDPNVLLTKEEKVQKHLSFVATALPYIMVQCCIMKHASSIEIKPFTVKRVPGLYQNKRCGDCGPVSVKFLEMHAYGDLNSSNYKLTDAMVDDLRRQYVLDIYGHYVLPLNIV